MILTRRPKRQWSMQELSSVGAGLCCAPLCATYPAWQSGCVILHKSLGHRINSASPLWLRRLQAASTWRSCLLHMHGLAFTYNCSKTFSCEYSFCLTVEMMELLAFFFFPLFFFLYKDPVRAWMTIFYGELLPGVLCIDGMMLHHSGFSASKGIKMLFSYNVSFNN